MWETIKKILQKQPGACIIVEDGKPAYIITKFSDYEDSFFDEKEKIVERNLNSNFSEEQLLERINQEISNWKATQQEQQPETGLAETPDEEVKIEDLPL
jgi:hypothetical protein